MEAGERLKDLLQHQLATDLSSVKHLPYVVSSLTQDAFAASSHLAKWTTRTNALIHSKEPSARWAGLCLAYKTAILSQDIMIESAQNWLGTVMPILSRNEPPPTTKAAIRLLRVIFTTAMHKAEFQRQISTPNVVKFSTTLVNIAPNYIDPEVKVLIFETLSELVASYPTTHRPIHGQLCTFTLSHLDGSAYAPTNPAVLNAAAKLYARLPLTGGKVGSVALWRKSVDDCLAFGWSSFRSIRTTFPGQVSDVQQAPSDAIEAWVPLNLDRIRCSIAALQQLLTINTQRPVPVPLGHLLKFAIALIGASADGKVDGFVNPLIRSMEVSVVPSIRTAGCSLLVALSDGFGKHITQNQQIATLLAIALEERPTMQQQRPLLQALNAILSRCTAVESDIVLNRLTKNVLPIWKNITISSSSSSASGSDPSVAASKKAKKRGQRFDGGEVFQAIADHAGVSAEETQNALLAIEVTKRLFRAPFLPVASQSLIARSAVSALLTLPRHPVVSSTTKANPTMLLMRELCSLAVEIGSGTTSVMSKALPFVLSELNPSHEDIRYLETLIHPRAPPLVRAIPTLEEWTFSDPKPEISERENAIDVDPQPPTTRLNPLPVPHVAGNPPVPAAAAATPVVPPQTQPTPIPKAALPVPEVAKPQAVAPTPLPVPSVAAVTSSTQNLSLSTPPVPAVAGPSQPRPLIVPAPEDEGDEDEDMPTINMDSDTDDEDGDEDMG